MDSDAARMLLYQADAVEGVRTAICTLRSRLEGEGKFSRCVPFTRWVPQSREDTYVVPAQPITDEDRQALRDLFGLIARQAELFRGLMNKYGCHEDVQPVINRLLYQLADLVGEDTGTWVREFDDLWVNLSEEQHSVPDELAKWARKLKDEAAKLAAHASAAGPDLKPDAPAAPVVNQTSIFNIVGGKNSLAANIQAGRNSHVGQQSLSSVSRPPIHRKPGALGNGNRGVGSTREWVVVLVVVFVLVAMVFGVWWLTNWAVIVIVGLAVLLFIPVATWVGARTGILRGTQIERIFLKTLGVVGKLHGSRKDGNE